MDKKIDIWIIRKIYRSSNQKIYSLFTSLGLSKLKIDKKIYITDKSLDLYVDRQGERFN